MWASPSSLPLTFLFFVVSKLENPIIFIISVSVGSFSSSISSAWTSSSEICYRNILKFLKERCTFLLLLWLIGAFVGSCPSWILLFWRSRAASCSRSFVLTFLGSPKLIFFFLPIRRSWSSPPFMIRGELFTEGRTTSVSWSIVKILVILTSHIMVTTLLWRPWTPFFATICQRNPLKTFYNGKAVAKWRLLFFK